MSQSAVGENREKAGPISGEGAGLRWLGDPKHKPLLNAENLTVTRGGRLFVTCARSPPTGRAAMIPLPDDLPKSASLLRFGDRVALTSKCFANGLANVAYRHRYPCNKYDGKRLRIEAA